MTARAGVSDANRGGRSTEPASRVIGVGLPRTGTTFLASMFARPKTAVHDFDLARQAFVANAYLRGSTSAAAVGNYLVWRTQAIDADADICGLNHHTMSLWHAVAPDAVYVLTLRDPLEWVDALARALTMVVPKWPVFEELRRIRCRPDRWPHRPGDEVLKSLGLFSLDAYLHWWASATSSALSDLPSEQLVVIPTAQIERAAPRLADATGWPIAVTEANQREINAAPKWSTGRSIIDAMPEPHVAAATSRHLGQFEWGGLLSGVVSARTLAKLSGV